MQPEQPQPYVYPEQQAADPGKKKRLVIGIAGLGVFIFAVIAVVVLMFSGPNHRQALGEITAKQQEVVRVSEIGMDSDRARVDTKTFAANSQVVAATHVAKLSSLVSESYGQPLDNVTLGSGTNSSIDTTLAEAEQNSNIDSRFIEIMKALLNDTNSAIQAQAGVIEDQETLQLLDEIYQQNNELLDSI